MGRKFNFASRFNAIDANRALGKIFLFLIFRICVYDAPSRLIEEGRIAIVTDVEAGSGGRMGCSAINRADEQLDTHGEIVWSWHPGADAKFAMFMTSIADDGGKNAGPRGDHV